MYKNIIKNMENDLKLKKTIPKIIHQLWIGPKPRPSVFMDTWKNMHPDMEYICWNEEEIEKRDLKLECLNKINDMVEINGKADIIRWEILYKYGGVFLDADSICIESIDDHLLKQSAFAGFENELVRKGLVATGTMGFYPNHPLCREAIDWILKNEISVEKTGMRAWQTVGPGMITRLMSSGKFKDVTIFPSFYFLPMHFTGNIYNGHGKVYSHQEWGSTRQHYEIMNSIEIPDILKAPKLSDSVSILMPCFNTNNILLKECLSSIRDQIGFFNIELVCINDGSDDFHSAILEKNLDFFKTTTRFCKIVYKKMDTNMGIGFCLHEGVKLCSNEIIIRMDSDDIMISNRIQKQIEFMKNNPECVLLGSNVQFFKTQDNNKIGLNITTHPNVLTWDNYKAQPLQWFMNHPTLCYKKSAVLSVGNYNPNRSLYEDIELELKILKKYGVIHNINEPLLLFRLHENQLTANGSTHKPDVIEQRMKMIQSILFDDVNNEHVENVENVENVESVENVENVENVESVVNVESVENVENVVINDVIREDVTIDDEIIIKDDIKNNIIEYCYLDEMLKLIILITLTDKLSE
jgi:glycosyltransferase involved in cell wall biosynthesis